MAINVVLWLNIIYGDVGGYLCNMIHGNGINILVIYYIW